MYEEQLKQIGLTDNEVRIYLFLLKNDISNPSKISQKLGLHRGYVYDTLRRMQEKGLVNSILKNNKKFFQATNPQGVTELLRMKLENFEKIAPDLNVMMNFERKETRVELHKGKKVYQTLLKDMIACVGKNEEVFIIGVDENTLQKKVAPIYLKQYLNAINTKNIKEKIIIKKGGKKIKSPNLTYKEVDKKFIGNTAQLIYHNKVAVFILGTPYHLIVIDNKEVANTYKKQFELLWKVAK